MCHNQHLKRQASLIHWILKRVEDKNSSEYEPWSAINLNYTDGQVKYHIHLCVQAGYLDAVEIERDPVEPFPHIYKVGNLTLAGHDALNNFRGNIQPDSSA